MLPAAALIAALVVPLLVALYYHRRWKATKAAHIDTVRTLVSAIDAADPFTRGHAERISEMSLKIGRRLNMTEDQLEELEYAALIHDIGRAAIYYDVLLKPGRLDDDEKALMQTHPKVGYDIIRNLKFMQGAAEIVHAHHEQPDGKGYPRGLSGEQIPVGSRIIMAAATYDAMTQDRPYRRGLSAEAAIEELEAKSGTQFFPDIVKIMIELHERGELAAPDPGDMLEGRHRLSA